MKNILRKNDKGITLISLVVMIIIILILATVGTNTGINVIRESKYHRAVSEMKTMQTKINEMYAEYKGGDDSIVTLGSNIDEVPSSLKSKAEAAIKSVNGNLNRIEDFRYYSAEYIKNTLDVDGVEGDYLINIKTREVISVDGTKNDGEMYYSLSQIENEQFNVEYINPSISLSKNGGTYYYSDEEPLDIKVTLNLIDEPYDTNLKLEYKWSNDKDNEPTEDWKEYNTEIKADKEDFLEDGTYYLWTKISNLDNGKELNVDVSKAFIVKEIVNDKVEYIIALNPGDNVTTEGTTTLYETYGSGYSLTSGGEIISNITIPTKTEYTFEGYYTEENGQGTQIIDGSGNIVGSNTAITSNTILYAKWEGNEYEITLNSGDKAETTGTTKIYEIYDNKYSLTSGGEAITAIEVPTNNTGFAFDGYYTGENGDGTQIIDENGNIVGSNTAFTSNATLYAKWLSNQYTVTFDGNGGTPSQPTKKVTCDTAIGTLPTASRENYVFKGWFTTSASTGGTQLATDTIITGNITYYARWTEATAKIGDVTYETLIEAINAVPTTNTLTTVTLLKNTNEIITVASNQKIELDLNANTLGNNGGNTVINNSGNITISNGNISSSATIKAVPLIKNNSSGSITINNANVESTSKVGGRTIENDGLLTINGGTIKAISTEEQVIENTSTGTVTMNGGNIIEGGTKHGIRNYGGKVYIRGGTINSTSTKRAAVHNAADNAELEITGGTIISNPTGGVSDQGGYAVYVEKGTCVIGTSGGNIDTTSPVIQGKVYGVNTKVNISFYDGIIKGYTKGAINDKLKITPKETECELTDGEEIIDGVNYKTLYLVKLAKITFEQNDGTGDKTEINVGIGKPVGDLPVPTRTGYIYKGWYLADGITEVTADTIVTDDITCYAHWAKSVTVTFDPVLSEASVIGNATKQVEEFHPIGEMPTASNSGHQFEGWYTSADDGVKITEESTVENQDVIYYAHWRSDNSAAIGDTEYSTLQEAVNEVPKNGTEVTIDILENTTELITITSGQNIVFDLHDKTLSNDGQNNVMENRGTVKITSGSVNTRNTGFSTINNFGTLVLDRVDITVTDSDRQAIYNNGGTVEIKGNSHIISNASGNAPADVGGPSGLQRATIQNFNGGTVTIIDGEIIGTQSYAIANTTKTANVSTVTIGTKDGAVDASKPTIKGKTYGVISTGIINFYDGTIMFSMLSVVRL